MNAFAPAATVPRKIKLTVDDFLALDGSGAFDGYAKTELIEGDVYGMNAQHTRHGRIESRLHIALAKALEGRGLEAFVETTISMPPHSAPEPDLLVTSHPEAEGLLPLNSVRLVIEVSDTTLAIDMGRKASLYARAGIPEYWVVDAAGATLHQLWQPRETGYAQRRTVPLGTRAEAATIEGLAVQLPAG